MSRTAALPELADKPAERRHGGELTLGYCRVDARQILKDDPPGAHIGVADLGIAHLPVGQPDRVPAGLNQRVGIFPQQTVIGWLARARDGISLAFGTIAPAVKNDEDERFGTAHSAPGIFSVLRKSMAAQRNKKKWEQ